MYTRLIAKRPDQPSSVYFDYPEVYRVATAAFSGNHPLDLELDWTIPWMSLKVVKAAV